METEPKTSTPRPRRWPRRLGWVVGGLASFGALVLVLLYFVAGRFAPGIANPILSDILVGRIEVRRIEHLSLWGASGIDAVLLDPEGRVVAELEDVSASVSVLPLVYDAVFGTETLKVRIDDLLVRHARLDLRPDASGSPAFLAAVEPKPEVEPPAPGPSRDVHVRIADAELRHVWAYGTPTEGLPLDAELRELKWDLDVATETVDVVVTRANYLLRRWGQGPEARGELDGRLRVALVDSEDLIEVLESWQLRLRAESGPRRLELESTKKARELAAHIEVDGVPPDDLKKLGVDFRSEAPLRVELDSKGTLPRLDTHVTVASGEGRFELEGVVVAQEEPALEATIRLLGVDSRWFGADLGLSPIAGEFRVDVKNQGDAWVGRLDGTTEEVQWSGRAIPALSWNASLDEKRFEARVAASNTPTTVLEVAGDSPTRPEGPGPLDFRLRTQAADLRKLAPELKLAQAGRADVRGRFDPRSLTLDVRANGSVEDFVDPSANVSIGNLNFSATATGTIEQPQLLVEVDARRVRAQEYRFERVELDVNGGLERARVQFVAENPDRRVNLVTTLGVRTEPSLRLTATDLDLRLRKRDVELHATATRLTFAGERLDFDGLALRGVGQADLSGHVSPRSLAVRGKMNDLALARLLQLADVEVAGLPKTVDLESDVTLTPRRVDGRLELATFGVDQDIESARLELEGKGDELVAHVEVVGAKREEKPAIGRVDAKIEAKMRGEPLLEASSWMRMLRRIEARGHVDMMRLSERLPEDTDLALGGRTEFDFTIENTPGKAPRIAADVNTFDLTARRLAPRDEIDPARQQAVARRDPVEQGISGVDLRLSVRHDPDEENTHVDLTLVTSERQTLLELDGDLHASLAGWEQGAVTRRLETAPFDVKMRVPERRLGRFPTFLGIPRMRGRLGAELVAEGTSLDPHVRLTVRARDVKERQTEIPPLDADLVVDFSNDVLEAHVLARGEGKEKLRLDAKSRLPWTAVKKGEMPGETSVELVADDFPLELITPLANRGVVGRVDATVKAEKLGTKDPRVELKVDPGGVMIREVPFGKGEIAALLEGGKVRANVDLRGDKWSLKTAADTTLRTDEPWSFEVGDTVRGSLRAEKFPIVLLLPVVSSSVADLDGKLDANVQAEAGPAGTTVEASASLREGRVHVPAIGQEIQDLRTDVAWTRDGRITLQNTSFRGVTGKATVEASARMEGIVPREARVELVVGREERMPLSLQGLGLGEFWGKFRAQARFEEKKTTAEVDVDQLQIRFPEIPDASVQSLDPDPHIVVGVRVAGDEFAILPLQPVEDEEPSTSEPSETHLVIRLGKEVWIQQGPSRRVQITGAFEVNAKEDVKLAGQLQLSRGRIEINGRMFDIEEGTVTFQPDEIDNPILRAEATWKAADGTLVIASFLGPVKSGKFTLRSEPSLPQGEILSLVLFGTTEGLRNVGSSRNKGGGSNPGSTALAAGGGVATQGLNQALSRWEAVDVSTRVASDDSGNARPEVVVQLTNSVSAQVGYNLNEPIPGKNPDRTLLTLELRLVGGNSLATTLGDRGSAIFDWTWRYRY